MSQFGLQMPGSQQRRSSTLTVYTGLLFLAVVALGAAVVLVWRAGTELSPDEGVTAPFALQEQNQIRLNE